MLASGLIVAAYQWTTAHQQGAELVSPDVASHNFTGKLLKHQLMPSDELDVANHGKPPENGKETHQVDSVTPGASCKNGDAEAVESFYQAFVIFSPLSERKLTIEEAISRRGLVG